MDSDDMTLRKNRTNGMVVHLHRERDRQQTLLNRIIQQPYDNSMRCVENNIETLDYLRGISCLEKDFVDLADNIVNTSLKLSHDCSNINREALSPTHLTTEVKSVWQHISELGNTVQAHVTHAKRYHLFYLDIDHLEQKIEDSAGQINKLTLELKSNGSNEATLNESTSLIKHALDSFVQAYVEWQKIASKLKVVAALHHRLPLQPGPHSGTLLNTVNLSNGERFASGSRVFVRASRPGDRLHREWFIEDEEKKLIATVPAPIVWLNSPDPSPTSSPTTFDHDSSPTLGRVRRSHTVLPTSHNNRKATKMLRQKLFTEWAIACTNFRNLLTEECTDLLNNSIENPKKKVPDDEKVNLKTLLEKITEFNTSNDAPATEAKQLESVLEKLNTGSQDPLPVIENAVAEKLKEAIDAYYSFQICHQRYASDENAPTLHDNSENTDSHLESMDELDMTTNSLYRQDPIRQSWKPHHVNKRQTSFESITTSAFIPSTYSTPPSVKKHHSKKHWHHRRELSQPSRMQQESYTQFSPYPLEQDKEILLATNKSPHVTVSPILTNPNYWPQKSVNRKPRSHSVENPPQISNDPENEKKAKEGKKKYKRHGFVNPFRRRHPKVIMDLVSTPSAYKESEENESILVPSLRPANEDLAYRYLPVRYGDKTVENAAWIQNGMPIGITPPKDALVLTSPGETNSTLGRNFRKHPQRFSIQPLSVNTLDSGVYTEIDSDPAAITTPTITPKQANLQEKIEKVLYTGEQVALMDQFTVACQVGELFPRQQNVPMLSVACQHGVCQKSKKVETENLSEEAPIGNTVSKSGKKLQVGKPWWESTEDAGETLLVETVNSSAQTTSLPSHKYVNFAPVSPRLFDICLQTNLEDPLVCGREQNAVTFSAAPKTWVDEIEEICIDSSDFEMSQRDRIAKKPRLQTVVTQTNTDQLVSTTVQTEVASQSKKAQITGISCELQFKEPGAMFGNDTDPPDCEYPTKLEQVGNENLRFYINFKEPSRSRLRSNSAGDSSQN